MQVPFHLLRLLLALTLVLVLNKVSEAQKADFLRLNGSRISGQEIERLVPALMDSAKVPGVALAISRR